MQNKVNKSSSLSVGVNSTKLDNFISCLTLENWRHPKPKIAVLRLCGVIGNVGIGRKGMTLEGLNDSIESAFNKSNLEAVCLVINSPGGSPVQSEFIAARIINLAKEKKVPVYSFVEDMAASGGYWIACAGDEIYVSKSSIVGSIGVISSGFGFDDAIKKFGIARRVYTQGINKSILDPFKPEKKEDIDILLKLQKHAHESFIDYIKSRRKGRLTQNDDILFNGEFWSGQTATDFGLVDGVDNMYSFIRKKFGDKVKIEYVTPKESWFKKKFMSYIDSESLVEALCHKFIEEQIGSKFRMY
jgi:signal peptide peptidase SppA